MRKKGKEHIKLWKFIIAIQINNASSSKPKKWKINLSTYGAPLNQQIKTDNTAFHLLTSCWKPDLVKPKSKDK